MPRYDRLTIIMDTEEEVSLVGYRRAEDHETADLERGFPHAGRWYLDYVDTFPMSPTSIEYAKSVADGFWGTIFLDTGEILCDDILEWVEYQHETDHIWWSVRDEDLYEAKCVEAFTELGFA
jgi:hypothetical protein